MADIHHKFHENHIEEADARHEKVDCKILSAARIDHQTHEHRPQEVVTFFLYHHSERHPDKQIAGEHRYRVGKRCPKCT